jgi:hypothetical protein
MLLLLLLLLLSLKWHERAEHTNILTDADKT